MAKTNIVVRNFAVTGGNYVSNIMYLRSRGVSNIKITDDSREAWVTGLKYQADKLNLQETQTTLAVLKKQAHPDQNKIKELNDKIIQYENDLFRNPTRDFIESGGMPDMVDDYDTAGGAKELYPNQLEKALDSVSAKIGKLSKKAESMTNSLFLTQDREGFKVLNNAVKMTDFVARYVLYKHYTDEARGNARKSHVDAMSAVQDEFINFRIPTHKMLQYGNDVGLVWFSKYQLRVLIVMANSMKDKPFQTTYNIVMANMTGASNIFFSIPGITKGAFQGFGNAFSVMSDSIPNILPLNIGEEVIDAVF
jgi:hypothetical protein